MNKLSDIRNLLKEKEAVFLNTQDEFLSEFTKLENNDVYEVSGFTGSNGYVVITQKKHLFFTDGRYTLQARQEIDNSFEIYDISAFFDVIKNECLKNVFFNFGRVSVQFALKLKEVVGSVENFDTCIAKKFQTNGKFYSVNGGINTEEKIQIIAKHLCEKQKDAFFVSNPQNVCWVLNIRGNDEEYTPVIKTTLLINQDGTYKLNPNVELITGSVLVERQISYLHFMQMPANKEFDDTITSIKAVKNVVEIEGVVNAHKVDGKILTQFFQWLENGYNGMTEWEITQKLLKFRTKHKAFRMPSFATICGCNANGAIIHYNPKQSTAKTVVKDSVVLIDSGGQFCSENTLGTTDVTRTVFLGKEPSQEYKKAFTLVLKGHIAVAMAVFNSDTPSSYFDSLARQFLKQHNMDYAHSTGHGVGAFLSVHESGCGISAKSSMTFQKGMVVSNEPGYYSEGQFGIRIESLLLVCENKEGGLYFETLTLVPIQEKSIDFTIMTTQEQQWLENYNQRCIVNANV